MSISGSTKLYGVVGDPVAHSLSPAIHNRWIAEAKLDAVYVPIHLTSEDAAADLRALARAGFSGLNVTLPHKRAALQAAAEVSPEAKLVGAANTLVVEPGHVWRADNTDVEGFALSLRQAIPNSDLKGARIVMIGAGGAARAVLVHLKRLGASVVILNRTPSNAIPLRDELAPGAPVAALSDLDAQAREADIVVNTASLGHSAGSLPPLPPGRGRPLLDLSYGKAAATTLAAAASAGWAPHDGLPMLVGQAAAAFRLWFKIEPDQQAALKAVRGRVAA